MSADAELLLRYVQNHDESAFRALVEQRIGFVFSVALRRLGNHHEAEEVTQAVFVALVKKSSQIAGGASVAGWLHRSCCLECKNLLRSRAHRLARETEAVCRGESGSARADPLEARELRTLLDETLNELPGDDRESIIAHYFLGQTYSEIGVASGHSEGAVRMRVSRALDQLRVRLERRGYLAAPALLAAALPEFASAEVSAELAAKVGTAAIAAGVAAPVLFLITMSTSKFIAAAAGLAVLALVGLTLHRDHQLQVQMAALQKSGQDSALTITSLRRDLAKARAERLAAVQAVAAASHLGAASAPVGKSERPGVKKGMPAGWHAVGTNPKNYDIGMDSQTEWGGMPSLIISSHADAANKGFGGVMQSVSVDAYRGQRVQLSGWMKTEDANDDGGHLWLRVDGNGSDQKTVQFDNMDGRAPTGTTDWQEYSVVLDVPADASSVHYGAFVSGQGTMWVNGVTLNPVSADVPSTNMIKPPPPATAAPAKVPKLPQQPVNLGFSVP